MSVCSLVYADAIGILVASMVVVKSMIL